MKDRHKRGAELLHAYVLNPCAETQNEVILQYINYAKGHLQVLQRTQWWDEIPGLAALAMYTALKTYKPERDPEPPAGFFLQIRYACLSVLREHIRSTSVVPPTDLAVRNAQRAYRAGKASKFGYGLPHVVFIDDDDAVLQLEGCAPAPSERSLRAEERLLLFRSLLSLRKERAGRRGLRVLLAHYRGATLTVLGERMGLSRERVRQIKDKTEGRLRKQMRKLARPTTFPGEEQQHGYTYC